MASLGTAGESSVRKFRQERRRRRREDWRGLTLLVALVVALAGWVALDEGFRQLLAAFVLGVALSVLALGWIVGFDARSLRYQWGAAGEKWTADELDKLGAPWHVFHDIRDGRSNWDHVVVGPGGVFLIDSKNLSGRAVLDENGLRSGRLRYGGAHARKSAVRLKEQIADKCARAVWVQSVVTVWGELQGGACERDRVLYVHRILRPTGRAVLPVPALSGVYRNASGDPLGKGLAKMCRANRSTENEKAPLWRAF